MDTTLASTIGSFCGQIVVLDTQGPLLYIGTLLELGSGFLVLAEADVHDSTDSQTTKELYIVESKLLGVRVNRERVIVALSQVASVSLLSEVRE